MEKTIDVTEICGNHHAIRALQVAAAGGHSIRFVGGWTTQAQELAIIAQACGLKARASSPCPCGNWGHPFRECTCSVEMVGRWMAREFHARDRFDITVEVYEPEPEAAVEWALEREERVVVVPDIGERGLPVSETARSLLLAAARTLRLHPRALKEVRSVAETIALMAGERRIEAAHMAEAIQYRRNAK